MFSIRTHMTWAPLFLLPSEQSGVSCQNPKPAKDRGLKLVVSAEGNLVTKIGHDIV